MTKYFVIGHDPLTPEQETRFKDALSNLGYWHWLPNMWLFKDKFDNTTAAQIRDTFKNVAPSLRCMVLDVQPNTWAGMTKKDAQGRDMATWIKEQWGKP